MNKQEGQPIERIEQIITDVHVEKTTIVQTGTVMTSGSEPSIVSGEAMGTKEQTLFLSGKTGKPLKNETVRQMLKKIEKEKQLRKKREQLCNVIVNIIGLKTTAIKERHLKKHMAKEAKRRTWFEKQQQINRDSLEGGELDMVEQERVEKANDVHGVVLPPTDDQGAEKLPEVSGEKMAGQEKAEKIKEKTARKGLSRKQKTLAWIGAALLGAAVIGGAAWGIHEAIEDNDNGNNVSKIHVMDMGETFEVGPNSIVSGDVLVNGERMFDDSETTGLIVKFEKKAKVTAPWGATVITDIANLDLMDKIVKQTIAETQRIHSEITEIDVVTFPGANPQGK